MQGARAAAAAAAMPARERDGGALAEQESRAYRETFGKGGVSHAQQAHAAAPSGALWDRYDHGAQSHLGARPA